MTLSVVFRCDASVQIGTGHVMRCLTLADELAQRGVYCRFVCNDLPGHLAQTIKRRGYPVALLHATACQGMDADQLPHSHWLPVSQAEDARSTLATFTEPPDWVVVDHYALDYRWEQQIAAHGSRIMVIDDLADRPHEADLLLDQSLGREADDYDHLVGADCSRLFGPRYALVRPAFRARRDASLKRREDGACETVLIAMGGNDGSGMTEHVLDAIEAHREGLALSVVVGGGSPHLDRIRRRIDEMTGDVTLFVDADNMADLMQGADLAIGAAGTMSWERCCMGLPTLLVVLAENQAAIADALEKAGAAIQTGRMGQSGWPKKLRLALAETRNPGRLKDMSTCAAQICDGLGSTRVAERMVAGRVTMRPAAWHDCEAVWTWRYGGDAARFYRAPRMPTMDEHKEWFRAALGDPSRVLLIAERDETALGHIRLDEVERRPAGSEGDGRTAGLSICMSPAVRGQGLAQACLLAALFQAQQLGFKTVRAEIHEENAASLRLFDRCGFEPDGRDGAFVLVSRSLAEM